MKVLLFICTLMYCLITMGTAYGQSSNAQYQKPPLADVPTPNAASLGQYGQVPVSYFNGLPSIGIPLHTITYRDISIPISLNYHAGGNKPDNYPGWVGLGWNLSSGGDITRIVNHLPDEIMTADMNDQAGPGAPFSKENYGYFFRSDLDRADWASPNFMQSYVSDIFYFDAMPDEFTFNVGDLSGSFFMMRKQNGDVEVKVKTKSDEHLRVEPTLALNQILPIMNDLHWTDTRAPKRTIRRMFSAFIITRADGTKYHFGGSLDAIDFNTSPGRKLSTLATSWHLTKIESPKGYFINLEYEKRGDIFILQESKSQTFKWIENTDQCADCTSLSERNYTLQHPSYLTKISSPLGVEVEFVTSKSSQLMYDFSGRQHEAVFNDLDFHSRWNSEFMKCNYLMQLDQVKIRNKRNINLYYTNTAAQRLRLGSVVTIGNDNNASAAQTHKFSYNTLFLPIYNAKLNDNWGYFNNIGYNGTPYDQMYALRTANETAMKAEVLDKITYPTGGETIFQFEQHDYSKIARQYPFEIQNVTGIAGGLRIRQITSRTSATDTKPIVWEYSYRNTNNTSSGTLSGIPEYSSKGKQHSAYKIGGWADMIYWTQDVDYTHHYATFSENAQNPLSTTSGNHVTYSRVIEKRVGQGSTVYSYTNNIDFPDQPPLLIVSNIDGKLNTNPFISRELERGLLLTTELYNEAGHPVRITTNQYNDDEARYSDYVPAIYTSREISFIRGSANKIYTFHPFLKKQTVQDFLDGSSTPITTVTDYIYHPQYRTLTQQQTTDSKGQVLTTKYRYPFHFLTSGTSTNIPARTLNSMAQSAHIVGVPIEVVTYCDGKITGATVNTYSDATSKYLQSQALALDLAQPLPSDQYAPAIITSNVLQLDPNLQPKFSYTKYDQFGNLLGLERQGGGVTSYLWGYSNTYPIAKVDNTAPNEFFHSNFEEVKDWDSNLRYSTQNPLTGNSVGVLSSFVQGASNHSFSSTLTIPTTNRAAKYIVSGWVWSDGPNAQIWLFKNTAAAKDINGSISYYNDPVPAYLSTIETGKWVYLEQEVTVPNGATLLTIRLTSFYRGSSPRGGNVYFDDIRLHPANAQMTTYTHLPSVGATSISDANNRPTYYEYDGLQRLRFIKDQQGNIVKTMDYNYKK